MSSPNDDQIWMQLAIQEAKRGLGLTSPNPPVGCVIVHSGKQIAKGWHQKAGTAHAERHALSQLDPAQVRGATVYVTLEPCSTQGRTGACTDLLIQAGVARVVYGSSDPNPSHAGRALEVLTKAGIEVTTGIREKECQYLIRGFSMVQRLKRPWVIAKVAMSLDGRITRPAGEGQWLSGSQAREEVQQLRAEVDAIMTSGETVRKDDPALTLRSSAISPLKEQPWRVVITQQGIQKSGYQLFEDPFAKKTLVLENMALEAALQQLAQTYDVNCVLVEAGGRLLGALNDADLIDEWVIYLTPLVTGGPDGAVSGEGASSLLKRRCLEQLEIYRVGDDVCARGLVHRGTPPPLERL